MPVELLIIETPWLQCLECGYKFGTLKDAEEAAEENGCPSCGGSDIDLTDDDIGDE